MSGDIVIRPAVPEDVPGLTALFQTAFHAPAPPAFWQWKYRSPAVRALSIVAEERGRIVGHYGGVLLPYRLGKREYLALQATDLMTHPSVRHRVGKGAVLLNCAESFFDLARKAGADFAFGFPGKTSRILGERYLDYRPMKPLERISLAATPGPSLLPVQPLTVLDADDEALLARYAKRQDSGVERDPAYWRWRYVEHPLAQYHLARHGSARLVLRLNGEEAWLADWVCEKPKDLEETLRGALGSLAGLGCGKITAWQVNGLPLPLESGPRAPLDYFLEYKPLNSDVQEKLAAGGWFTPGDYDAM